MSADLLPDPAVIDEFLRELAAWNSFVEQLRHGNRHVVADASYFDRIVGAALSTETVLPQETQLARARRFPAKRAAVDDYFASHELAAPPAHLATSGRLNPEGIACLYLADSPATAIAEVRPWVAALVAVAPFATTRPLRVLDLTSTSVLARDRMTIRCLSRALAHPMQGDDSLAYVGTQFLAESLRSKGVDGVKYESALRAEGWNLALFDTSSAVGRGVSYYRVDAVQYSASQQFVPLAGLKKALVPRTRDADA